MNKVEFLNILKKSLKKIPKEERENAIEFYSEYLNDATNEQEAIESLPHPKEIASKIILEVGEKEKSIPITTIILAICSAPITLPIALACLSIVIALIIVFIVIICVPYIVFGSLLLSGILLTIAIIPAFFSSLATGLVFLGMTLILISGSCLALIGFNKLAKIIFSFCRNVILKLAKRGYQNEK